MDEAMKWLGGPLALVVLLSTPSLAIDVPRVGHSAVLLSDGRVLLIGGRTSDGGLTATTEIIDPANHTQPSGPLGLVGSLAAPRWNAVAMNVPGRGVLLVGGQTPSGPTGTIERFDEVTGLWSFDSMTADGHLEPCWGARADGEVWVAGGRTGAGLTTSNAVVLRPWLSPTGTTVNLRVSACGAVGLPSNQLLLAGGVSPLSAPTTEANLVQPGQFTLTPTGPLPRGRWGHTLTSLRDGGVLLIGGWESAGVPATSLLQFDPPTGTWRDAGTEQPFVDQVTFLLPTDLIAIVQSADAGNWPRITRLTPSGTSSTTGGSQLAGNAATWMLLHSGHLFASGGHTDAGVVGWTTSQSMGVPDIGGAGPTMRLPRGGLVATLLPDGHVLAAGGATAVAELLDRASGVWLDGGVLQVAREDATATLLLSGEVLIAGGHVSSTSAPLASVERYDPATGSSRLVRSMRVARSGHAAVLLTDGRVLVAGGAGLSSTELYDPQTDLWSDGPVMPFAGPGQATLLMPDGRVFLQRNTQTLAWDLADGGSSALSSLGRNLAFARAGLGANGSVYLVGGVDATGSPPTEMQVYNLARFGGWTSASSYLAASNPLFVGFDNGQIAVVGGRNDAGLPNLPAVSMDLESYYIGGFSPAEGHAEGALVWLPEGDALIIGGRTGASSNPTANTQRLEPVLFPPLSSRPRVQPVGDLAPGQTVRVTGTGFMVPSGGGLRSMDDRVPVVSLRRTDNGALRMLPSRLVSTTELELTLPTDLPLGHGWLTVTVRAVPSVAVSVRVARPLGAPCVEGSICASWSCTSGLCAVDAGAPDAGTLDAGTTDAGTTDAGATDAGMTDAGATDAGATDAGATDAGATDAGATDAGATDAGMRDAGMTDAGTTDGGAMDAGELAPPRVATVGCACSTSSSFGPWMMVAWLLWAGRRRASVAPSEPC